MDISKDVLIKLFEQAPQEEKELWTKQGAEPDDQGVWKNKDRTCLPDPLYPATAQEAPGPTHLSKGAMVSVVNAG